MPPPPFANPSVPPMTPVIERVPPVTTVTGSWFTVEVTVKGAKI